MSSAFADALSEEDYTRAVNDVEAMLSAMGDYNHKNIMLLPDGEEYTADGGRLPIGVKAFSKADIVEEMRRKTIIGKVSLNGFLALFNKYVKPLAHKGE